MKLTKKSLWLLTLRFAIASSIFSQITPIENLMRPIMYVLWFFTLGYSFFQNRDGIRVSKFSRHFAAAYAIWFLCCMIATMQQLVHLSGNYVRIMLIPLMVLIIGDNCRSRLDRDDIISLCKTYSICALVFAFWVQITYFGSYSAWLSHRGAYTYVQKNSAAQIWSTGFIIIVFLLSKEKIQRKKIWYAIAVYLLIVSALSQCRTALLGIAVAVFCLVVLKSKRKLAWILGITGTAALLWYIPATQQFIRQSFLLDKFAGTDLNTMSSGRVENWTRTLAAFNEAVLLGKGRWYVDCSFLMVLAECGLVGFVLIESVWGHRIYLNLRCKSKQSQAFMFVITFFYIIESVLEGYPPFGPGVSSFMFWFLSAVYCT